tara:strand:- start:26 stop:373 length:348 start_codon:yes stop_codon:yes gene_type:complete
MSKKSARKGTTTTAEATDTATTVEATEATGTDELQCTEEEITMLGRYRAAGEDCVKELGQLEIRKARIMASYGQLEAASQNKLMEIGKRLNIEEGTAWTVKPDGAVEIQTGGEGA